MLAFEDLLLANLLVRRGLAAAAAVQQALEALDAQQQHGDLLALVARGGGPLADPHAKAEALAGVRRYLFGKSEAAFAARARQMQAVPSPILDEAIARQQREGFVWSLGERLVSEGKLAAQARAALDRAVAQELQNEEAATLARHRASRFGETVGTGSLVGQRTKAFATVTQDELNAPSPPKPPSGGFAQPQASPTASGARAGARTAAYPPPPPPPSPDAAVDGQRTINLPAGSQGMPEPAPAEEGASERTIMLTPTKDGPLSPGRTVAGKYVVLDELGRGGMGIVYRARDREHGEKDIALKCVPVKAGDEKSEVVQRFKREILTASLVDDENVCAVYDAGEAGGLAFMAMELVEGETLKEVVKREAPLPPARALELTAQVLKGLAACHESKVIHRDLKPENVRLTKKDGREVAKLVDFGIARLIDQAPEIAERVFMTVKGKLSGTPVYVAPELVMEPEMVDARCDIYAVGVILYELLTGKLPFTARTLRELLQESIESRPIPLAEAAPGHEVPEPVERLLWKLLEKDPLVRPQTAKDALALLEEAQGGGSKGKKKSKLVRAGSTPEGKKGCFGVLLLLLPAI